MDHSLMELVSPFEDYIQLRDHDEFFGSSRRTKIQSFGLRADLFIYLFVEPWNQVFTDISQS